jgi:iron complex transport system ATP-binding protein
MAARQTILALRHIRIERGGTVILHDLSWRVACGEHWVVLGANGSGKTSLLRALTGYFMPTAGDIELLGQRYGESDWRELRRRVGIVSSAVRQMMADHEPALATIVSGKHAVIDLWQSPTRAEQRAARRILDQVEGAHLAERPWGVLSQGERQRVLIGRALMAKPKLLILDEPCAGLDPAAREHFLQFTERLGRRPDAPTLVLVTHHVEEIMPVFTHALVLHEGRVLASGRKLDVLKSPVLTRAFGTRVSLTRAAGRYALRVATKRGVVV